MSNSNSYNFTPKQRQFFERHQMAFNSAVQSGIQMICIDNDLEGQWQIRPDGKGLERVDGGAITPVPAEDIQAVNGRSTH
jgi:hypothetical protein